MLARHSWPLWNLVRKQLCVDSKANKQKSMHAIINARLCCKCDLTGHQKLQSKGYCSLGNVMLTGENDRKAIYIIYYYTLSIHPHRQTHTWSSVIEQNESSKTGGPCFEFRTQCACSLICNMAAPVDLELKKVPCSFSSFIYYQIISHILWFQ